MIYRYIGGSDAVEVYIAGQIYPVERGGEIDVPDGALDNHPEFELAVEAPVQLALNDEVK